LAPLPAEQVADGHDCRKDRERERQDREDADEEPESCPAKLTMRRKDLHSDLLRL
jgi:hypothetical protein